MITAIDAVDNNIGNDVKAFADQRLPGIIKKHADAYVLRLTNYITQFIDHLMDKLFNEVGRCGKFYKAFMDMIKIVCEGLLEPIMGFSSALVAIFCVYVLIAIFSDFLINYYSVRAVR